jgi:predicted dehydrogenase
MLLAHFGSETPQPVSAPDQVLVSGLLANGAPLSIHYRGGTARDGDGLFWEINGTVGAALPDGGARRREGIPPAGGSGLVPFRLAGGVVPGNVGRMYARMARDLWDATHTAPSFEDAVVVHRVIVAIERAAESGSRTVLA